MVSGGSILSVSANLAIVTEQSLRGDDLLRATGSAGQVAPPCSGGLMRDWYGATHAQWVVQPIAGGSIEVLEVPSGVSDEK